MQGTLWHHCLRHLENEVPEQQFNTWVRHLQAVERDGELQLLAPNRFVVSWIEKNLFGRITELVSVAREGSEPRVRLDIGSRPADRHSSTCSRPISTSGGSSRSTDSPISAPSPRSMTA